MRAASLLRRAHLLCLLLLCMLAPAAAQSSEPARANLDAGAREQSHAGAGTADNADAVAPHASYDDAAALARSQAAIGRTVGDYTFQDGKDQPFALRALRGKPAVISLIYTSCHHVCPTVTSNLAELIRAARDALGDGSFSVLTVGFDTPNDTPQRMRVFAAQRGIDIADWHFVSASAETLRNLVGDVGFSYFSSPKGFDHMIQATVLDGKGTVYRQIYGAAPKLPLLVEPLKEIIWGKQVAAGPIAGWINNIKFFCTVYDPANGKYRFDLSPFIAFAIAVLVLGAVAWVIVRSWRGFSSTGPSA